jgi:splicing factor 3A subunit 2|mmetsp:Transcript_17078/g.26424  ORF Transcript_17078/g.26424 Transcript_17078/m.26424 type:complete len:390 (+) Transcript_17078:125-1294(+)|eukprot:CAMPEP_0195291702 /NCGR_PEP_ID=MMETSP0707-20130614/8086_1 /TAXON_ID=33640 /ORGANISM="Asterionellopsis glacialis, Strain CCMP134" /LENGTH=389 /DNA_ID=CAMNT_0040352043 /DNA_START=239 /DNA_END=1408 /DNA_ORIENTATION=+
MLENPCSKNIEIDHVDNDITFLVETPRGRTAVAAVPPSVPYESFVGCLWEAAAARDLEHQSTKSNNCCTNKSSNNKRQVVGYVDEATTPVRRDRNVRRCTRNTFIVHNGKVLGREEYHRLMQSSTKRNHNNGNGSRQQQSQHHAVSLRLRLRGGVDRQNRVGSKFGGGGVSSSQNAERERKERLKQLALESIDLAKDPYLMRNHLGTYECKLCLTLHTNEANYLAHTQGKKHQAGLAKRAAMEKARAKQQASSGAMPMPNLAGSKRSRERKVRIGRPAYQIYKNRDVDTNQRCLSFELQYPEIDKDVQPRHRFMSSYEQRIEPADRRYQYLLVAADPYETVAFKIPNEPIDKGEGRFVTHWDEEGKKFTLTLYLMEPTEGAPTTLSTAQ